MEHPAQKAARHHTTLSTFYAVIALMEGGLIYDPAANSTSEKIIKLCRQEAGRQLKKYDAALAKAKGHQS